MADTRLTLVITADGRAAITTINQVTRATGDIEPAAKKSSTALSGLSSSVKSLALSFAGGLGVAALARGFLDSAQASERLALGFRAVSGSASASADEMAYVRQTAAQMGLEVTSAADAYLSLTAAAKGTALEGKASRDIFEAVSRAMAKLGKSSADTQGALLAIEQMISKGTVSAEELRGQLGERLPGAFQSAARAMGVTTEGLGELLETGRVTAEQMLPALAAELNKVYDDGERVGTMSAEWNRFSGEISRFVAEANAASGATDALAGSLRIATDLARAMTDAMTDTISGGLGIAAGQWSQPLADLNQRMTQLKLQIKELDAATKDDGWFVDRTAVALAERSLVKLRDELGRLEAQRRIYIEMAGEDRQAELGAAAARRETADATRDLSGVLKGVDSTLALRVRSMIADAAKEGIQIGISSGLRTPEHNASIGGSPTSNHLVGKAVDLTMQQWSAEAVAWVKANADRYGITFPVKFESPDKFTDHLHAELVKAEKATTGLTAAQRALKAEQSAAAKSAREHAAEERKAAAEIERKATEVERLVEQYLPARAAAEDLAEAELLLAEYGERWGLSAAEQTQILGTMRIEMDKAAKAAENMGQKIPTVAELWTESLKELSRNLQNTLGDAFTDLFDGTIRSAKDAMDRLKDVILSALSDLAAALLMRPINVLINGVLGTTTAVGATGAQAAGLTGTGGTGGFSLGSIGQMFSGTGVGNSLAGLWQGAGNLFSGGAYAPGGAGTFGSIASGVSAIPNWAFGVGGIGGGLLGSALFGDKGYGAIGSSIGSAIGTAAGASAAATWAAAGSVFGPVGAIAGGLIGGVAGGWLGSLFGSDKPKPKLASLDLQGGAFKIAGGQGDWTDAEVKAVQATLDQLNEYLSKLSSALGPAAEELRKSWSRDRPQTMSGDQIAGWLEVSFKSLVGGMASVSEGMLGDIVRDAWEKAGGNLEAFLPLVDGLVQFVAQLPAITERLQGAGYQLGANAEQATMDLLKLAGSLDNLLGAKAALDDVILSDEAKQERQVQALRDAFGSVGLSLPETREALGELVTGLDLTTDQGRRAYLSIASITGALGEFYRAADAAAEASMEAAEAGLDRLFRSQEEMQARSTQAIEAAFAGLGLTLPTTRDELEALVGSFDLTSEQGRQAYLAIAAMAEALGIYYDAADAAAAASREAAEALMQMQAAAADALRGILYTEQEVAGIQRERARAEMEAILAQAGIDLGNIAELTAAAWRQIIDAWTGGLVGFTSALGAQAQAFADAMGRFLAAEPTEAEVAAPVKRTVARVITEALDTVTAGLLDWVRRTRGEVLDVLRPQSLDITQSQFASQLALAQSGNASALGSITEYADRYLQAARAMSTTRGGYEEVVGFVTARVEALTRAGRGADDPMVDELQRLREEARAADLRMISLTDRMQRYMAILERWEAIGLPGARA